MKKISSKYIFISKKIFPIFWFGFLVVFTAVSITSGTYKEEPIFLLTPLIMAIFGFFIMKKMVLDLADEVYDCGDSLLVKNRGIEEKIPLSNIMNVSAVTNMNPPRITLRLATPSKFGQEISFSPASSFTFNPFAKNAVAEDLIVRVDRARTKRML